MRIRSPASRGSFAIRFSAFDVCWAFVSPWLALWIRGAQVLNDWPAAAFYCAISFVAALIAFLIFRTREGMTDLFSVHDALEVAKAVLMSEFMTCLVLFSATRLEGIPRSTPLIHALILAAGLLMVRAFVRMIHSDRDAAAPAGETAAEHIIMIGSNRLSSLYIGLLRAYAPERHRVVAVLDDRDEMAGRSIAGVPVLGPPSHLLPVIEEFKDHGIRADRIIIGGDEYFLTQETKAEVDRVCNEYKIQLDYVPRLIGLSALAAPAVAGKTTAKSLIPPSYSPPRYFRAKRSIDFVASLVLIVVLLPLLLAIASVVLLDVGSPVFFWQRRTGMNGRIFQMHKFRTLKPAFDARGTTVRHHRPHVDRRQLAAQSPPRRIAPTAQRAGRRHVADRAAAFAAGRSAEQLDHASDGSPGDHRLGAGERRQAAQPGGKERPGTNGTSAMPRRRSISGLPPRPFCSCFRASARGRPRRSERPASARSPQAALAASRAARSVAPSAWRASSSSIAISTPITQPPASY